MPRYLIVLFAFFITSCCKHRDEYGYLTDDAKTWFPDSIYLNFTMKSSTGISEYYYVTGKTINDIDYSDSQCSSLTNEHSYAVYETTYNKACHYELRGMPDGTHIEIDINDNFAHFILETRKTVVVNSVYTCNPVYYPNYTVSDETYYDIFEVTLNEDKITLQPNDIKTIYIARHFGFIKFVQKDGMIWERL